MIRIGILGTGFGEYHARLYKKIEGVEIVSLFGRNPEKLDKIGKELNINTTMDINEIVEDPTIDLLDICLPTELHAKWAIKGIKNNKHIFCETPISFDIKEAEKMKQASLQYNKNIYVDLFLKFSTPHSMAIRMAKDADLGKLFYLRAYNKTSPRWGNLDLTKNAETFHIHNIDFVQEIMGTPEHVSANGISFQDKSILTSTFNYKDSYAVLESNSSMPDSCPFSIGFELVFSHGIIKYNAVYGEYTKTEFEVIRDGKPREVLTLEEKDDYEETTKHVISCLNNNVKSELIDINCAIESINTKDKILHSLFSKG